MIDTNLWIIRLIRIQRQCSSTTRSPTWSYRSTKLTSKRTSSSLKSRRTRPNSLKRSSSFQKYLWPLTTSKASANTRNLTSTALISSKAVLCTMLLTCSLMKLSRKAIKIFQTSSLTVMAIGLSMHFPKSLLLDNTLKTSLKSETRFWRTRLSLFSLKLKSRVSRQPTAKINQASPLSDKARVALRKGRLVKI